MAKLLETEPGPSRPALLLFDGPTGPVLLSTCVLGAVIDAVAHLGVRHIDMPTTPQRVWTAINEAQKASHQ